VEYSVKYKKNFENGDMVDRRIISPSRARQEKTYNLLKKTSEQNHSQDVFGNWWWATDIEKVKN
jgi:hypothetical protein